MSPLYTGEMDVAPADQGISTMPASMDERLDASMRSALEEGPTASLFSANAMAAANGMVPDFGGGPITPELHDLFANQATVPIEQARARVKATGLDIKLPERESMNRAALDLMIDHARTRRAREATIARGPQGILPGALDVATSLLVGALDPIGDAMAVIPVMGEARYAKLMASAGESIAHRAAIRGGIGAGQGAAFTTAMQPIDWLAHTQDGRDYGMADVLHSIVWGAGLFGALHVVGGSAADVWRRSRGRPLNEPIEADNGRTDLAARTAELVRGREPGEPGGPGPAAPGAGGTAETAGAGGGPGTEPGAVPAGARASEPGAETAQPGLTPDQILARPEVQMAIRFPRVIDRNHDVPYGAGSSEVGGVTFIDRHIPREVDVAGKPLDPGTPLNIHEQVEHALMVEAGMPYAQAHQIATAHERAWVEANGYDWRRYEDVMDGLLDHIEHENPKDPPADLYTKPYPHKEAEMLARRARLAGMPVTAGMPPQPAPERTDGNVASGLIAGLPPRAREDAMRGAVANLISGEPVRVGEMLVAAGREDPRIADALDGAERRAIADDVTAKLVRAGMSGEEAAANAAIVAARYATRAERLGGGSPFGLYRAENIDVRGGEPEPVAGRVYDQDEAERLYEQATRLPMDTESRLARAREMGFDTSKVWFHGARRSDRLTETGKLERKRATSGPMPYFTDDPEIASNYAKSKADTSFEAPADYAEWFKVKVPGARKPVDINRAWFFLDAETRRTIAERAPHINIDDDGHITYAPDQGFPAGNLDAWTSYYLPREGRGNPLKALSEVWLNGGILFNDEERFLEVLRHAGMKDVEFHNPHHEQPGVLPVYLKIRNPLDTADTDGLRALLPELEQLASRSRRQPKPGLDVWHKSAVTPRMWLDGLKRDLADGTSYAWTTLPDEITAFLESKGYDGIVDRGGKFGGTEHAVMIPFRPDQVRSVNAKFDQAKADSARMLDQPAQTGSPEFRQWFGGSKVVDADGRPMVMYHGTKGDIGPAFDESKRGTATGSAGSKLAFFFTSKPSVAETYAEHAPRQPFLDEVRRLEAERDAVTQRRRELIERGVDWSDRASVEHMEDLSAREREYQTAIDSVNDRAANPARGAHSDEIMLAHHAVIGPERARELASAAGEAIMPAYLAVKNPVIVDGGGKEWHALPKPMSETIAEAKAAGHDGVIFRNIYDPMRSYMGPEGMSDIVAVFEPEQIKSAVGNRGTFAPDDPRVLYQPSRRPPGEDLFAQREAEGQTSLPGTDRIGQGELAQRRADEPLKPKAEQKPLDIGLFGDDAKQKTLFQTGATAPTFFSAIERAVTSAKQDKASPEQWLGMLRNIPGVKAEEMEWLGLGDWLKQHDGPVTRQEIADYVRANAVEVREVIKGQGPRPTESDKAAALAWARADGPSSATSVEAAIRSIDQGATHDVSVLEDLGMPDDLLAPFRRFASGESGPKYGSYTLAGGENYRELLLTLPVEDMRLWIGDPEPPAAEYGNRSFSARWQGRQIVEGVRAYPFTMPGRVTGHIDYWPETWDHLDRQTGPQWVINSAHLQNARFLTLPDAIRYLERYWNDRNNKAARRDIYHSPHWDESNTLAHIRFDDRTGPNGERILHVAEIQSDWHQKGRKYGYAKADDGAKTEDIIDGKLIGPDTGKWEFKDRRTGETVYAWGLDEASARDAAVSHLNSDLRAAVDSGRVPDAPFKTTWPELALKRMIRYAAEHGYDRLTWDTGETNAVRYDLSKQIHDISLRDNSSGGVGAPSMTGEFTGGTVEARDHAGKLMIAEHVYTPDELADVVGKELAERLLAAEPRATESAGLRMRERSLSGLDLKVGGEGMLGFYDDILPKAAQKLVKKFGGKVGLGEIATDDVSKFDIEPAGRGGWRVVDNETREPVRGAPEFRSGDAAEAWLKEHGHAKAPVHSLAITPELRKAAMEQGFPLFQRDGDAPRGRITMREGRAIIDLFKSADRSTFMHEAGHLWLEELVRDAQHPEAPAGLKDDMDRVLSWLGVESPEDIGVAHHEQWARGFEQYLAEGRAPSSALADVFAKFKDWLLALYRGLVDAGVPITDDIRGVMDRLLATDREIASVAPAPSSAVRGAGARGPQANDAAWRDLARAPEDEEALAASKAAAALPEPPSGDTAIPKDAPPPDIDDEPLVTIHVRKRAPSGPRARPEETWTLFEFLASRGGLKPTPDLAVIFGGKNPFVPGFGPLLRPGGMGLDRAREAAVGARYLFDEGDHTGGLATTTERDLLEKIDEQARGRRQYRIGNEPVADQGIDPAELEHHLNAAIDGALEETGVNPADLPSESRARALEIMTREHVDDPHVALERVYMEEVQNGRDRAENERIADHIPGWDVPDDGGAAPPAGRAAAPGGDAQGAEVGGARGGPGRGDREARSRSTQAAIADEERIAALYDEAARAGYLTDAERRSVDALLQDIDREAEARRQTILDGARCLLAGGFGKAE